eukprot:scaffold19253_cov39-Phaeocystis_antarctica.AAC.1
MSCSRRSKLDALASGTSSACTPTSCCSAGRPEAPLHPGGRRHSHGPASRAAPGAARPSSTACTAAYLLVGWRMASVEPAAAAVLGKGERMAQPAEGASKTSGTLVDFFVKSTFNYCTLAVGDTRTRKSARVGSLARCYGLGGPKRLGPVSPCSARYKWEPHWGLWI